MSSDLCLNVLDKDGFPTCFMTLDEKDNNTCVFESPEETRSFVVPGFHKKLQIYAGINKNLDAYHGTFVFYDDDQVYFIVKRLEENESYKEVYSYFVDYTKEDFKFLLPLMMPRIDCDPCTKEDLLKYNLQKDPRAKCCGITLLSEPALHLAFYRGNLEDNLFLQRNLLIRVPSSEQGPAKRAKTSGV